MLADARLVTISEGRSRSRTRRCCANGRACAAGSRRTPRAAGCTCHLTHAARDWQSAGRDPAELYRGARLASALDWSDRHEQELNGLEREFLAASRAAGRASRASASARRTAACARCWPDSAALLALALVAGAVAVSQRGQARDAALTADAQRLGAEALTRERLDHALLLARAGVALEDSAVTRSNLLSVLMRQPQALGMLPGDGERRFAAAVSPDERLAAVGGESGDRHHRGRSPAAGRWASRTAPLAASSRTFASRRTAGRSPFRVKGFRTRRPAGWWI